MQRQQIEQKNAASITDMWLAIFEFLPISDLREIRLINELYDSLVKNAMESRRVEIYIWFPVADDGSFKSHGHASLQTFRGGDQNKGIHASIYPEGTVNAENAGQLYKPLFSPNTDEDGERQKDKPSIAPIKLYTLNVELINQLFIEIQKNPVTSYYALGSTFFTKEEGDNGYHLVAMPSMPNSLTPCSWLLISYAPSQPEQCQLYHIDENRKSTLININIIPNLVTVLRKLPPTISAEKLSKRELVEVECTIQKYQNSKRFNCVSLVEYLLENSGLMVLQPNRRSGHSKREYGVAVAMGGTAASIAGGSAMLLNNYQKNSAALEILKNYNTLFKNPGFFPSSAEQARKSIQSTYNHSNKYVIGSAILAAVFLTVGSYCAIKFNSLGNKTVLDTRRPPNFFRRLQQAEKKEKKQESLDFMESYKKINAFY